MNKIAELILSKTASGEISVHTGAEILKALKAENTAQKDDIAIIGISLNLPRSHNAEAFWDNLREGLDLVTDFPEARKKSIHKYFDFIGKKTNAEFVQGAYLEEIDQFDNKLFRLSPREASLMSPSQRLFLQTAWETIEDAGMGGDTLSSSKTGVYVGFSADEIYDYKKIIHDVNPAAISEALPGNITSIVAGRISYLLNLKGPSLVVDTACSSSLVAVHLACQALLSNDCDMALAGGVKLNLALLKNDLELGIHSADSRTKTFDDSSDGTTPGEGVAAIMLKPLRKAMEDKDNIYAVIKGSAVNQDGNSIGITAPNAEAQEEVIVQAWKNANIHPESISYIEAHGTGTKLGDPIEVNALRRAFERYTNKKQFCAIGSVKSNIGHLDSTAGIVGLIKVALALKHGQIPPSLHFVRPNRNISFEDSPLFVSDKMISWPGETTLRRCGVSSFGLSGTNCHMVLEEAPKHRGSLSASEVNIFTLSSKSRKALRGLITRYIDHLDKNSHLNISDICYTANVGRGHYEYRIAIMVSSAAELAAKLKQIQLEEDGMAQESIYYREHHVVPDNKTEKGSWEITSEDKRIGSHEADLLIRHYSESGSQDIEILDRLCQLYVKGAKMDWASMYRKGEARKVSLPAYAFESTFCWIDIPEKRQQHSDPLKVLGPLLNKELCRTKDIGIYSAVLSPNSSWVLNEHRINGNPVLVGTAYLEMAMQAFIHYLNNTDIVIEMSDIFFLKTVTVQENECKELHIIIKAVEHYFEFEIVGAQENGTSWDKHVEGKLHIHCKKDTNEIKDIGKLLLSCNTASLIPNLDNKYGDSLIQFGPRWHNIKQMYIGINENVSFIELGEAYVPELQEYYLHPALMDNALATESIEQRSLYLPFNYKSVTVHRPIPKQFYSHVRRKISGKEDPELIGFDVTLLNLNGETLVEIKDYYQKKADKAAKDLSGSEEGLFQTIKWIPQDTKNGNDNVIKGAVILFGGSDALTLKVKNALLEKKIRVFHCQLGEKYGLQFDGTYSVDGSKEEYEKFLSAIDLYDVRNVIHMQTLNETKELTDIEGLEHSIRAGCGSLLNIIQAGLAACSKNALNLWIVTDYVHRVTGREEQIKPENATLLALGKVINQEYMKLHCSGIDIDSSTSAENIISELSVVAPLYQCAYREGMRYVEEVSSLREEELKATELELDGQGVYVITGGMGVLGLETAKLFASKNKVNLALLNRSDAPDRTQWNRILKEDSDKKLCWAIQTIQKIEESGSKVRCCSADVSDEMQLSKVLADLRREFGVINGIVHAAGIAGSGFLFNKDEEFYEVLRPKVWGTFHLFKATQVDQLQFFILFSAGTTITGAAGQGDYTAANAYLDSFAAYARLQDCRAVSINWASLQGIGMAADHNADKDGILKVISVENAGTALDKVLGSRLTNVIIGEINFSSPLLQGPLPLKLSTEIMDRINRNSRFKGLKPNSGQAAPELRIKGRKNDGYSNLERVIAQAYSKSMGLKEINIFDNFYELGGDSLIGMNIINHMSRDAHLQLEVADLFEFQSVAELAKHLNSLKAKEPFSEEVPVSVSNDPFPLSSAQKRIYFMNMMKPQSTAYNNYEAMLIHGVLDKGRLERAFIAMLDRHEVLRSRIVFDGNEVFQQIDRELQFRIDYMESEPCDIQVLLKDFVQPFELDKAPLIRVRIVKRDSNKHVMLIDIHHIIFDGISMGILIQELSTLYNGNPLPELPTQYRDYVEWQNQSLESERIQIHEQYWSAVFNKDIPKLNLPTDYPRKAIQQYAGNRLTTRIDRSLSASLKDLAEAHNITLYMLLLTTYNVLLHKYSGQEDIVVGSAISGRSRAEFNNLIGVFINILPMRNMPRAELTFEAFMQSVRDHSFEAYKHQEYPFEKMMTLLDVPRDLSRNPLFDAAFIMLNMVNEKIKMDSLEFEPVDHNDFTSKYDLTLKAQERKGCLEFEFEYCTDLFKHETMERIANHYVYILQQVVDDPTKTIAEMEVLNEIEKKNLTLEFNNTFVKYDPQFIHQMIEGQAEHKPDAPAIWIGKRQLTYSELNAEANRFSALLRKNGIIPGQIIGVILPRSFDLLIGIIGILKAGAVYLPIDLALPDDRIKLMLESCDVQCLVTTADMADKVQAYGIRSILADEPNRQGMNAENTNWQQSLGDLAYVIFTSGSTGKPKGVMIEHQALTNFANGIAERLCFQPGKTILGLTTVSFDIFILETLVPLANGMSIVLADEAAQTDLRALEDTVSREIHIMQSTPSRIQMMLDNQRLIPFLSQLEKIIIGGEALPEKLFSRLRAVTNAQIYNVYGPSETTVWSTVKELKDSNEVTIGTPIANTQVYIVDRFNRPQPIGVDGELLIGGDGLARGYYNNQELTRERFIDSPFVSGRKVYRTGDIARWLSSGDIQFIGRNDNQVKLRGYRIELGEIEKTLLQHPHIKETAVVIWEDDFPNGEKLNYLSAFIVADDEVEVDVQELKLFLRQKLPAYLIPANINKIAAIPVNVSGKLDRKSLIGQIVLNSSASALNPEPATELERKVMHIWEETLGNDRFGVHDNFFDIGGNSLLIMRMLTLLEEVCPEKLTPNHIFLHPTVSELCGFIQNIGAVAQEYIEPKAYLLPDRFFAKTYSGYVRGAMIQFTLEEMYTKALFRISAQLNIEVYDLLYGMYSFVLRELGGASEVELNWLDNDNRIRPLSINLSGIMDFTSLFAEVHSLRKHQTDAAFGIDQLNRFHMKKGGNEALIIFYEPGHTGEWIRRKFDIAVQARIRADNIEINCEFNKAVIEEEPIEALINMYAKALAAYALNHDKLKSKEFQT